MTESFQKNWMAHWPDGMQLWNCEWCDWVYLRPLSTPQDTCPHCGSKFVSELDAASDSPVYTQPPELVVPFTAERSRVDAALMLFAQKTLFAPKDLQAAHLVNRLQKLYLPMWLVDTAVSAQWEAEVGFNYDVVSHREQFKDDQWQTQRYTETKVRWEPRVGTLNRQYNNTPAPALEEQPQIETSLGKVDVGELRPYQATDVQDTIIRLPNRSPEDAWTDAAVVLNRLAAEECGQAATANHLRGYRWSATYENKHWTQLLYPLYVTHYWDDDGQVQMVFLHGTTGKLAGAQRASMKKARRWSLVIGGFAGALVLVGLLLLLLGSVWQSDLLAIGGAVLTVAFWIGIAALVPVGMAWYVNYFKYVEAAQHLVRGILHASSRKRR